MKTFFDAERSTLADALAMTEASLCAYGERYRHWCIAYSGGKDSTATLTAVVALIEAQRVPQPQSLSVRYGDTIMELPPLKISAEAILHTLRQKGYDAQTVKPPLDDRFFVYMFGRGVPPPTNRFRWCTPKLKIEPMLASLAALRRQANAKILMLTGVRLGESATRDARISLSCSRDGAECGQGWFQEATSEAIADTLAPLLHWRVCHVWEWLRDQAPAAGFPTAFVIADVYGGRNDMERLAESSARTGCVGCNLASRDDALRRTVSLPQWSYLSPLLRLKPLYAELKRARNRLRKDGTETRADGTLVSNPNRLGPLTFDARRYGLGQVLTIQEEINAEALRRQRPEYCLIDPQEHDRILQLIDRQTWPERWDGDEPTGDRLIPEVYRDGSIQDWLFKEATTSNRDPAQTSS